MALGFVFFVFKGLLLLLAVDVFLVFFVLHVVDLPLQHLFILFIIIQPLIHLRKCVILERLLLLCITDRILLLPVTPDIVPLGRLLQISCLVVEHVAVGTVLVQPIVLLDTHAAPLLFREATLPLLHCC